MKSNKIFSMCASNFHNDNQQVNTLNNESSLLLKPSENLKILLNQFNNNASPEDNNDPENVVQFKYDDINKSQTMKIPTKDKSLALFHINACSQNKIFDELAHLLCCKSAETPEFFVVMSIFLKWMGGISVYGGQCRIVIKTPSLSLTIFFKNKNIK